MSAESPSRSSSQTRKGNGPPTVLPQQVTDPTILDSVAGFINEVVPASYAAPCDTKDQIQWAHFEQLDTDESLVSLCHNGEKVIPAALILVLGYTTGIQVRKTDPKQNTHCLSVVLLRYGQYQLMVRQ